MLRLSRVWLFLKMKYYNESSVRVWYDGVIDAISKAEKKAEAVQRGLISLKKDLELQVETEKAEVQKNEADEKMRMLKRQAEAARTRAKDIDIVKLGLQQKATTEKKKGPAVAKFYFKDFTGTPRESKALLNLGMRVFTHSSENQRIWF